MHLLLLIIALLSCENLLSLVPQTDFYKYQIKPFFGFHAASIGVCFSHCTLFFYYSG